MSKSKTPSMDELSRHATMLKALSNPYRLKIFLEFARCEIDDGKYCGSDEGLTNCQVEFAEEFGLAPSTVSHHFKELRQAGLIDQHRDGKNIIVGINAEALEQLRRLFS